MISNNFGKNRFDGYETVFLIICLEELVKVVFEAKRLHSKKWIKHVGGELG